MKKSSIPGLSHDKLELLLRRNIGHFSAELEICPSVSGNFNYDIQGREWIIFNISTLDENVGTALNFANDIISKADFSDLEEIYNLYISDTDMEARDYAYIFSGYQNSRFNGLNELWNGMNKNIYMQYIQ